MTRSTGLHFSSMLLLLGVLAAATSCAEPQDAPLGTVGINLIGQAPSGAVYRLRHATLSVTGPGVTRIWNTEDTPDQTSLSADVPVARYTATLAPGWSLERIDPQGGSAATRVMAELVSDNPVSFTVIVHQRTTVPLQFHVNSEAVDLAQGYEVVVGVEEAPPQLIVVTNQGDDDTASITVYPVGPSDDVAPLRTIAGPLTTLDHPEGVTVANHEIVVCDSSTEAISFFALLASGNVAPVRQIVGDATEIDQCLDVAVFDDEVYVLQLKGLLVFSRIANGNARPLRRVSGFTFGQHLAIDHNELFVTHHRADGVFVFSLPVAEEATPARFLSVPCATGVTAGDGELFVVDECADGVAVYPQTASGTVPPLRSFGRLDNEFQNAEQMSRFRNHLYVAVPSDDRIWIFADTAAGDDPPFRTIGGPHTGLDRPVGVAVH